VKVKQDFRRLVDCQFVSLLEVFKIFHESSEDICKCVALNWTEVCFPSSENYSISIGLETARRIHED
jgi:hypothetical protein